MYGSYFMKNRSRMKTITIAFNKKKMQVTSDVFKEQQSIDKSVQFKKKTILY